MISVIVPVYNVGLYLNQCIDSILKQTYRDLEILLIDDGSPDRCKEICDEYAKKDHRIRLFHTENKGLSAARNLGLREAKGEYIGFVDSDDWIEPNMYENLLRQIEKTNTDISTCAVWSEYMNSKEVYSINNAVFVGLESVRALIYCINNGAWNKLYKSKCWAGIFFPEGYSHEDVATIYKVFLNARSISCIPDPLYHYRIRDKSITHIWSMNNLMDYWIVFYDRYKYLSTLPDIRKDQTLINKMEEQLANKAAKIWRWVYGVPKEQRDYVFLRNVSCYVRKHFPLFGKKEWRLDLRICIFFSRFTNEFSFLFLYALNNIYRRIRDYNRSPYPFI